MIAISERLGYWTAEHPDWTPNADWPREVGSVLYDHPETLVLVDPLIRDDWFWVDEAVTAAGNPVPCC